MLSLLFLIRPGGADGAVPRFPSLSFSQPPLVEGTEYAKYEKYPPYCSVPDEMERRAVPPLGDIGVDTQLVHVTALIRHGARTPYDAAPTYKCWDGFWEDDETGVWDCDLKTYTSPPASNKEKGVVADGEGIVEEAPEFLFEKRYDALDAGRNRTGNSLNGTCQLGQLIMRGYEQELRNGQHLRQAYFYDGDNTADEHAASDARMRLWDLTKDNGEGGSGASTPTIGDPAKKIYQEPNLRYRADDEQRTLMSGQVLLRGLFERELLAADDGEAAVVRLHTADYSRDVLGINAKVCPRAQDLYDEAYASEEYKKWTENSVEVKKVNSFIKEKLGMEEMPGDMLDCLMTTMCTDRTLPDSLDDYDGSLGPTPWEEDAEGSAAVAMEGDAEEYTSMFERIVNVAVKKFTFPYKYNDAAYAKLGMGPLWKEIMANILPVVDSARNPPAGAPPPKLALFSGHDTTLMPILATLGDGVWSGTEWAHYASMIQIEVHRVRGNAGSRFPSGYAFRLIYNGKVLTSRMDGCAAGAELCDSRVLVERVTPFAKYAERDCASAAATTPPSSGPDAAHDGLIAEMESAASGMMAAPGGVFVMAAFSVLSMMVGGLATWCVMRRGTRKGRAGHGYRQSPTVGDVAMADMYDGADVRFRPDEGQAVEAPAVRRDDEIRGDKAELNEDGLI